MIERRASLVSLAASPVDPSAALLHRRVFEEEKGTAGGELDWERASERVERARALPRGTLGAVRGSVGLDDSAPVPVGVARGQRSLGAPRGGGPEARARHGDYPLVEIEPGSAALDEDVHVLD